MATLREIDRTDTKALQRFIAVPALLHGAVPTYVPPLQALQLRRLRAGNAALGEAQLRLFQLEEAGQILATASLLLDPRHSAHRGVAEAFFGFFEAADAHSGLALLDHVAKQARAAGMVRLLGPRNLSRVEDIGLLIEGHDQRPPMLASYHPPRYQALLEAAGFRGRYDMLAYEADLFDGAGQPRALPQKLADKAEAARAALPGVTFRRVGLSGLWSGELSDAYRVFTEAYADVPEVVPMAQGQFLALGRLFLLLANHDLLQLAYDGQRPVAMAMCLPDLNQALHAARAAGGRLSARGLGALLRALPKIDTASFKLIGVVPGLRHSGLHALLISKVIGGLRRAGYRRLEASLIHQDNAPMRRVVEGAGMTVYQRYRIFEKDL